MTIARTLISAALLWAAAAMLTLALGGCSESGDTASEAQAGATSHVSEAGETDHEGGADHGEHAEEGHAEEARVKLTAAEMAEFGIELRSAGPGTVALSRDLPGEVVLNPNRVAQVTPRVPGVASEVRVSVGDHVEQGQVMAVLSSRELAQAKSAYLAAQSQLDLTKANFERAESLWQQKITAKADYLAARQALAEARVNAHLAEGELQVLGLSQAQVERLAEQPGQNLARYELTAPIAGEVIQRHVTEGEVLHADPKEPPFVVADLGTVWVKLTVHPKDLAAIRPGQKVTISADQALQASGTIDYVSPVVGEATRTATARVVLQNVDGRWKPGLFVKGQVQTDVLAAAVVVPKTALQTVEGKAVVFVQTPEGFEAQPVEVGRGNGSEVQILSGLAPGQRYVAVNPSILKAEMSKSAFGGHAH